MRRIRRALGKTPLTTLFKPKNHFSQICKLMVAPMEGTHGDNFFFQMGYQVEKCYAKGCQKNLNAEFGAWPSTAPHF